jgi:hypothetical protein
MEMLLEEAHTALKPLADEHAAASLALQDENDREQRQQLEDAITEATQKLGAAKAASNDAQKVLDAAVWARSRFLRQLDLRAQGRA